jgi:hypothetical protein
LALALWLRRLLFVALYGDGQYRAAGFLSGNCNAPTTGFYQRVHLVVRK